MIVFSECIEDGHMIVEHKSSKENITDETNASLGISEIKNFRNNFLTISDS